MSPSASSETSISTSHLRFHEAEVVAALAVGVGVGVGVAAAAAVAVASSTVTTREDEGGGCVRCREAWCSGATEPQMRVLSITRKKARYFGSRDGRMCTGYPPGTRPDRPRYGMILYQRVTPIPNPNRDGYRKSAILALAAPEPNDGDEITALAACNNSSKIRNRTFYYLNKKGSLESSAYLRESNSHEVVPFAIPVGTTDVICNNALLLELGGGSTLNEIGEQSQKDQSDRIAVQTDILQEWDRKMATVKACGSSKSSEQHMASRGKRKSINNLIEENYPKKAIVVKLDNTWEREAVACRETLEKISSGIKSRVEAFKKDLGDVFVVPPFDPPPDKYDGVPGVILRATDITDSSERDFFTYVQQDMKTLQCLANTETIDKIAFSSQINKILVHWTKLFSSHISGGMEEMIQALNELKGHIVSDALSPLPFDAAGITARETRVEEALKEAAALQQVIPGALKEISEVKAAALVKCTDLAALKEKQKKIDRLKASLVLAEKNLKLTESRETEIELLLKESEAARQDSSKYSYDLKKTIDSGEPSKTEVQKCMQYIGAGSKITQTKPVRSLISYMQSSSCED